jgi:putative hydrolase of the HAD superfamily
MARPTVRCVVFDVDDTLYLERDYVHSGFRAIGPWAEATVGVERFAERAWAEFEAGRRGDIFNRVMASAGKPAEAGVIQELVRRYREHIPAITLLTDARACLDRLLGHAALAAVTDGPMASQRAKVAALGLDAWLVPIVVTAELGEGFGKPHPRPFRLVEERTGLRGEACAYVADNPAKDFGGPASLGWRTVRLRRRAGLHSELPSGADVESELTDLTTLPTLLGVFT